MTPIDLDAVSAAAISWLLTYALHSTILLGAALLIATTLCRRARVAGSDLEDGPARPARHGQPATGCRRASARGAMADCDRDAEGRRSGRTRARARARTCARTKVRAYVRHERASERPNVRRAERQDQACERRIDLPPTYGGRNFSSAARLRHGRCWPSPRGWRLAPLGLARFGWRFVRLHRRLRSGPAVSEPHLRQMVEALTQAAGTRAPIRLTTSATCAVPLALAGRQVVVPHRFLQLDAEQQHAALAHEVAHVVRRDPAWRVVAGVLERAFFFQPLNRLARVRLCESAEFLCDQWAVSAHPRAAGAGAVSVGGCGLDVAGKRRGAGRGQSDGSQRLAAGSPRDVDTGGWTARHAAAIGRLACRRPDRRRHGRAAGDRRTAARFGGVLRECRRLGGNADAGWHARANAGEGSTTRVERAGDRSDTRAAPCLQGAHTHRSARPALAMGARGRRATGGWRLLDCLQLPDAHTRQRPDDERQPRGLVRHRDRRCQVSGPGVAGSSGRPCLSEPRRQRHRAPAPQRCARRSDRSRRLSQLTAGVRVRQDAGVLARRGRRAREFRPRARALRPDPARGDQDAVDRAGVAPSDYRPGAAVPDRTARCVQPGDDSTRGRGRASTITTIRGRSRSCCALRAPTRPRRYAPRRPRRSARCRRRSRSRP